MVLPRAELSVRSARGIHRVYPQRMDECTVDGEVVRSQGGTFYGGWITDKIVGPFKGS